MFIELAATTNFSFLRGASHPEELVVAAASLGSPGLAVADRNTLAGVVRCHLAAREVGVRTAVGCRLVFQDGTPDILAWPTDRRAYGRLCRLLTLGNIRGAKADCRLDLADLVEWCEGLVLAPIAATGTPQAIATAARALAPHTGTRLRLALSCPYGPCDARALLAGRSLAQELSLTPLATNLPLYHAADRRILQDVLTAVREHTSVERAGRLLEANAERHLKSPTEMARLFASVPEAVGETMRVMEEARFSLDELRYEYPEEPTDEGRTPQETLVRLTHDGAAKRYPEGVPGNVAAALSHELALIEQLEYAPYFLTVYDVVRFARERKILAQGRGSAANSAVCFCLGVTEVDPARGDLLFERFISPERREPPDIDVDFEHERREEVIQYVYDKYGRDRAGIAATVITYRARSAAREVGKALGLSEDAVSALSGTIWGWSTNGVAPQDAKRAGLDPSDRRIAHLIELTHEVAGFPRHLSQHVGGFVITRGRLDELVPVCKAAMEDRTNIEWDKDDLDALGILKIDVLALGMLTCVRKGLALLAKHYAADFPDSRKPAALAAPFTQRIAQDNDPPSQGEASQASLTSLPALPSLSAHPSLPSLPVVRRKPDLPAEPTSTGPRGGGWGSRPKSEACLEAHLPARENDPPEGAARHGPQPAPAEDEGVPQYDDWPVTLATIPPEDPEVYDMICRADTLGVFQIESRAQMTMLPRLRPRTFYDLVIEVAIVRPGPIQGDMVHPYLRRRQGKEPVTYPSQELRQVLEKTLGVPLFQEQCMRIAIVGAGFSPAEADQLRRAMATFRKVGTIGTFQHKLTEGLKAKGYDPEFADRCFRQIEGFGEYGFPESHAASFALLVYASCWLKCHYPDVFCAALLNSQPMGFYAPAQIVRDARQHGVEVRAVDVNHSDWDCSLEPGQRAAEHMHDDHREMEVSNRARHAVRLGLRQVKGLNEDDMRRLVALRGAGYDSVRDVWLRTGLPRATIERLADADAFASLGLSRREALWCARGLDREGRAEDLPLFAAADAADLQREQAAILPPMPPGEEVINDYRFLSLSLRAHPATYVRDDLASEGIVEASALARIAGGAPVPSDHRLARNKGRSGGRKVSVAGLVLVRQRPGSAKGVIFMTIEDESGIANVIVWPKVFEAYRQVVLGARFVKVTGRVQSEDGVVHLVAHELTDRTAMLTRLTEDPSDWDVLDRADEVKRPSVDLRTKVKPRSALARLMSEEPELEGDLATMLTQNQAVVASLEAHRRAAERIAGTPSQRDDPARTGTPVPAPHATWGTARSAATDMSNIGRTIEASARPAKRATVGAPQTRGALPKGRNFH